MVTISSGPLGEVNTVGGGTFKARSDSGVPSPPPGELSPETTAGPTLATYALSGPPAGGTSRLQWTTDCPLEVRFL